MKALFTLLVTIVISGCAVTQLPQNLSRSMLNQQDPDIVEAGAPAYLLLLDALVLTYPENKGFLMSAAQLYGAYAGVFADNEAQAKIMADKAMSYSKRALCGHDKSACNIDKLSTDELASKLAEDYDQADLAVLYSFASAWAGWIQANSDNWLAIAQLSKVKTLLLWVNQYDSSYDNGTLQVYLGVLETQLPPSLGGRPDLGQQYFEKALELTDGQHLMAKVLYAKQYARLMFEQELHDKLLSEVIAADPNYEGLTLINRLAQRQASELLATSSDYFE